MIFRPLVGHRRQRQSVPVARLVVDRLARRPRRTSSASTRSSRWEDGTPVTSDDVRFTIERIRDPKIPAADLALRSSRTWRRSRRPTRRPCACRFQQALRRAAARLQPARSSRAAAYGRRRTRPRPTASRSAAGRTGSSPGSPNQKLKLSRARDGAATRTAASRRDRLPRDPRRGRRASRRACAASSTSSD